MSPEGPGSPTGATVVPISSSSAHANRHTGEMSSETTPWSACQVCGHGDHAYRHHLNEVQPPQFVATTVARLRSLERAHADIDPLVRDTADLVEREEGGSKAWAIWLFHLLEELEEASDAPDVAAEIESFLIDGYTG